MMDGPEETVAPKTVPTAPSLDDQVRRWAGDLLVLMGPKISTDAYNALSAARDNLTDILNAAQAAQHRS